ncbi:MAG: DUF6754 domain-containing protein, partial [Anaerolineaceae bacterium]|nr:DUF6754 domain-containing protein [Anaerolineaceae bacterium]
AGLMLFYLLPHCRRLQPGLRFIPAIDRLGKAISLAVEKGERIHISLGKASILDPACASALSGLNALARLAQISLGTDRPMVATSGEGALAILSQDTLRNAHHDASALDQYDPDCGRLSGATRFAYITGALSVIQSERVAVNIMIGNFSPEAALLCDAADNAHAFTLAASDSLEAQSVLYAVAEAPLIGEELFALPAYLKAGAVYQSSLLAQDGLRWVLVVVMVVGSLIKLASVILGVPSV